ncbi:MAG TPA: methyltransferase domain-containing protein, partial [Candidatus Dormibacteraeota bacterium]|nr:methyltransferase domain-containing protein [Candidatus Dormibacteraeota bacterium]
MSGRTAVRSSIPVFERIAGSWAPRYRAASGGGHGLRARRDRLVELLGEGDGDLLDVGCGPAVMAGEVVSRGWRFVGVDGSRGMVRAGRAALAEADLEGEVGVADAQALPFGAGAFSAVICTGVLDGVPDRERALAEMVRVLRPGGRLVVSFANRRSPYALWTSGVYRPAVERVLRRGPAGERAPFLGAAAALLWTPASAAEAVEATGATVDAVRHYYFNPCLPPLDELLPRAAG